MTNKRKSSYKFLHFSSFCNSGYHTERNGIGKGPQPHADTRPFQENVKSRLQSRREPTSQKVKGLDIFLRYGFAVLQKQENEEAKMQKGIIMNINKYKATIKEIVHEIRKNHPEITNDTLYDNGAIYYQNGNDGTEFDWKCNDCLCEFMVFHKQSEMGFIKLRVNRSGTIETYTYKDGEYYPSQEEKIKNIFNKKDAEEFAATMLCIADNKNQYDINIDKLEWNADPNEIEIAINCQLTQEDKNYY